MASRPNQLWIADFTCVATWAGIVYVAFAIDVFAGCIEDADVEASVGTTGDSYDNDMAETIIGLFKTEVIHARSPWRSLDAVEYAAPRYVSGWPTHLLSWLSV